MLINVHSTANFEASGIAARCAVVGMTATGFSIADPNDDGMLNVVGSDSAMTAWSRTLRLGKG